MNYHQLFEYVDNFEYILSLTSNNHYYSKALERQISYSKYFQEIENDANGYSPYITDKELVKEVMTDLKIINTKTSRYSECLWAAEAFLRIQGETHLTFECIFLYIPIDKMYEYYPLYHEMDFSRIIEEFKRLFSLNSSLSLLINKQRYSIKELSLETGISYNNLYSLKERRRDIKNMNALQAIKLAKILDVRIETLTEAAI